MNVVCAGYIVRNPLGGHVWHHLQYLVGLKRLGCQVAYIEHHCMENFCYHPVRDAWTSDPSYGIGYMLDLFRPHGLDRSWCYIGEGEICYGMDRRQVKRACREADLLLNLSNINMLPEFALCRKRVLVDTDPVFTQIGAHGLGGPFSDYDALFTYGENVHLAGCTMPTAGHIWHPTRQPVVLDLWQEAAPSGPGLFSTVTNWNAFGEATYDGRIYGNKARQFEPFFGLPRDCNEAMEIAVDVPADVRGRLIAGGWTIRDPLEVTLSPHTYQAYLRSSKAEFSVAKHAYVVTNCGWFSDRSAGYLASGRPVVIEDTGFSHWLDTGCGVLPFRSRDDALASIDEANAHYGQHAAAAREICETYFDSAKVLTRLIDETFEGRKAAATQKFPL